MYSQPKTAHAPTYSRCEIVYGMGHTWPDAFRKNWDQTVWTKVIIKTGGCSTSFHENIIIISISLQGKESPRSSTGARERSAPAKVTRASNGIAIGSTNSTSNATSHKKSGMEGKDVSDTSGDARFEHQEAEVMSKQLDILMALLKEQSEKRTPATGKEFKREWLRRQVEYWSQAPQSDTTPSEVKEFLKQRENNVKNKIDDSCKSELREAVEAGKTAPFVEVLGWSREASCWIQNH